MNRLATCKSLKQTSLSLDTDFDSTPKKPLRFTVVEKKPNAAEDSKKEKKMRSFVWTEVDRLIDQELCRTFDKFDGEYWLTDVKDWAQYLKAPSSQSLGHDHEAKRKTMPILGK